MADVPAPGRLYHISFQPRNFFGFAKPLTIHHIHEMIGEFKRLREGLRLRSAVLHSEGVEAMRSEETIERMAASMNRDRKVTYKDATSPIIYGGSRIEIEDEGGQLAVEIRIRDKDNQMPGVLESALGWLGIVIAALGKLSSLLTDWTPVIVIVAVALLLIIDGRRRMINKVEPRVQVNITADEQTHRRVMDMIKTITK
ncbi:MAG: hypothetical protein HY709_03025 [Candidatus Latescibacteria bacterium]|nr:hypothetical protein [Candidatus Latescibacterota bacterium]